MKRKNLVKVISAAMSTAMLLSGAAFAEEAESGFSVPMHNAAYEGTAHSAAKKHELINLAMDCAPGNLAPEVAGDSGSIIWKWEVYERLFTINGLGGELIPETAQSYEQIDDVGRQRHYEEADDADDKHGEHQVAESAEDAAEIC